MSTPSPHTPQHTFVHSRGVRLHVLLQGPVKPEGSTERNPLVLFIHGFGGGYFDFEPLFAQLEGAPLRLAAVDLRGYGRSDKTPRGYDLTTAASDMAGVIRRLGYSSAHVVGHGYGGLVAWTMAAHEPERIDRLVTLSSAHPTEQAKFLFSRPLQRWRHTRGTLFAQLPRLPERALTKDGAATAEKIFRTGVAPGFRDTPIYREFAIKRREAMQVDKVAHLASEYRRWAFRSRFRPEGRIFDRTIPRRIEAPVLAIDGSMDPNYSPELAARSLERGAAGSRAELIYGVGHYPHIEDPVTVAELLRAELLTTN